MTYVGGLVVEHNAGRVAQHFVLFLIKQWPSVNFQEPRLQIFVHHKVAAEQLA